MNTAALKTKLDTKAQAIAESVEEETAAALAPVDSNYLALSGNAIDIIRANLKSQPLTKAAAEQIPAQRQTAIYPGRVWRDTDGRRIQAHGGALFYEDGIYYWYGENKDRTDGVCGICMITINIMRAGSVRS